MSMFQPAVDPSWWNGFAVIRCHLRSSDVKPYDAYSYSLHAFDNRCKSFMGAASVALLEEAEKLKLEGEFGFVKRSERQIDLIVRKDDADPVVALSAVLAEDRT